MVPLLLILPPILLAAPLASTEGDRALIHHYLEPSAAAYNTTGASHSYHRGNALYNSGQQPITISSKQICADFIVEVASLIRFKISAGLRVTYGERNEASNPTFTIMGIIGAELSIGKAILTLSLSLQGSIELEFTGPRTLDTNDPMRAVGWAMRKLAKDHITNSGWKWLTKNIDAQTGQIDGLVENIKKATGISQYDVNDMNLAFVWLYREFIYRFALEANDLNKANHNGNQNFSDLRQAVDKAKTVRSVKKMQHFYRDAIEKIWSGVYLGRERSSNSSALLKMDHFSCKDVKIDSKKFVLHTVNFKHKPDNDILTQAGIRMCILFKSGVVLGEYASSNFRKANKQNQNIKRTLAVMYPYLFPSKDASDAEKIEWYQGTNTKWVERGPEEEKMKNSHYQTQSQMGNTKVVNGMLHEKITAAFIMLEQADKVLEATHEPTKPNTDPYLILSGMMAQPVNGLKDALTQKLDDMEGCARSCTCGLTKVTLSGKFGLGIGEASTVCKPDNVFLLLYGQSSVATSAPENGDGVCKLGEFKRQAPSVSVSITPFKYFEFKLNVVKVKKAWSCSAKFLVPKPSGAAGKWAKLSDQGVQLLEDLGAKLSTAVLRMADLFDGRRRPKVSQLKGPVNGFFSDLVEGLKGMAVKTGWALLSALREPGPAGSTMAQTVLKAISGALGEATGTQAKFEVESSLGVEITVSREGDGEPIDVRFKYITEEFVDTSVQGQVHPGISVGGALHLADETEMEIFNTTRNL